MNLRWQTAVHESAHAVYAIVELGAPACRLNIYRAGGLATITEDLPPNVCAASDAGKCEAIKQLRAVSVDPFKRAVFAACGPAGSRLARFTPPPVVVENLGTMVPKPATATPTSEPVERPEPIWSELETDAEQVASWAATFSPHIAEGGPRVWASRWRRVHAAARLFAIRHKAEILDVAQRLFEAGTLTIQASDLRHSHNADGN